MPRITANSENDRKVVDAASMRPGRNAPDNRHVAGPAVQRSVASMRARGEMPRITPGKYRNNAG